MNNKRILIASLLVFILTFILWVLWSDKALTVRSFTVEKEKLPSSFDGFTIAHVSDLHNASFGNENEKLLKKLEEASPDIIAVTGDIIDSRRTDIAVAERFIEKAVEIAPVYYVTGNHEARVEESDSMLEFMKKAGVIIADGKNVTFSRGDESIIISGISDPYFSSDYLSDNEAVAVSRALEELGTTESYRVLLAHRPEFFSLYCEYGFDLVLSGHAHGGQFRFPFVGGFIAPGQGLFPTYDSGAYSEDNTTMLVSRGLGNSIIPLRFNNRPEIIIVTLTTQKS